MMHLDVGCVSKMDGSCRWTDAGGSLVVASAVGPTHVSDKNPDPTIGSVEVRCSYAERGVLNRALLERALEDFVGSALNAAVDAAKFPRQTIAVSIYIVLEQGGGAAAAALNAAVVALSDARVPMRALPLAVEVWALQVADEPKAGLLAVVDTRTSNFVSVDTRGTLSRAAFAACLGAARRDAAALLGYVLRQRSAAARAAAPAALAGAATPAAKRPRAEAASV
ncbi:hypothetical protein M885DRAFT_585770 [Pelagophyceae sp. CCMP2097]|nr:hypothetical protein M885DRAFT_585770 [Pelagophyceae sp. CCMP2097]